MSLFLGVDGGGTKTALCLVSDAGEVAASLVARSGYHLTDDAGTGLVTEVLTEAVAQVLAEAGAVAGDVRYAFFGIAGYGEVVADVPALDAAPRTALGHDRYRCDNDMVAGWAGSLGGADGVNVVSGTGSIAYGERGGVRARTGGWGEVFGDEGSGHWIGVRGLAAFSRMSDGRAPAGPLMEVLREHLDLASDLDLVDVVLTRWRGARAPIAALSRVVAEAARCGDECASAILADAGAELALLAVATARRLGAGGVLPVSFSGGVFSVGRVREAFTDVLVARGGFDVRQPLFTPVIGAALHAARLAGEPLSAEAVEALRRVDHGRDGVMRRL